MPDRYVVFRCQHCGRFTFSPLGQKTRLCGYCGKIIKINTAYGIIVDDRYKASLLVKRFNAKDGWKEFKRMLEEQKEKVLALVEEEGEGGVEGEVESGAEVIITDHSKMRRLLKLLEENCRDKPIHLDELRRLCAKYGLEEEWVLDRLEALSREGLVIFPDPWHLKYVSGEAEGIVVSRRRRRLEVGLRRTRSPVKAMFEFLRKRREVTYEDLRSFMESEGFTDEQLEKTLETLISRGMVIKRVDGVYEWVGD